MPQVPRPEIASELTIIHQGTLANLPMGSARVFCGATKQMQQVGQDWLAVALGPESWGGPTPSNVSRVTEQ